MVRSSVDRQPVGHLTWKESTINERPRLSRSRCRLSGGNGGVDGPIEIYLYCTVVGIVVLINIMWKVIDCVYEGGIGGITRKRKEGLLSSSEIFRASYIL